MKSTDESPREFWIAMTDFRLAFAALRTELRDRFQRAEAGISSHPDLDRDRTLPLGKQIAFRTALELVDEFEDKIKARSPTIGPPGVACGRAMTLLPILPLHSG